MLLCGQGKGIWVLVGVFLLGPGCGNPKEENWDIGMEAPRLRADEALIPFSGALLGKVPSGPRVPEERNRSRAEVDTDRNLLRVGCGTLGKHLVTAYFKKSFEEREKDLHLTIELVSFESGLKRLQQGFLDLVLSNLPLRYKDRKKGLEESPLAVFAMVPIVHPKCRVWNLNSRQVSDILSGRISDWSELTNRRLRIALLAQGESDPYLSLAMRRLFPGRELRSDRLEFDTAREILDHVSRSTEALALVPNFAASDRRVRPLSVNGVFPDSISIRNGSYPLTLRLYLVRKSDPDLPVLKFVSFASGTAGRKLLSGIACGFD